MPHASFFGVGRIIAYTLVIGIIIDIEAGKTEKSVALTECIHVDLAYILAQVLSVQCLAGVMMDDTIISGNCIL